MIVVDTNTLLYLYVPGEHSSHAEDVLKHDPDWTAPRLWRSEFRNVLAWYVRQRRLVLEHAQQIAEAAEAFMDGRGYEVPSRHVLAIASACHCSAYDCEFVVLAQQLHVPLVTSDQQILRVFPTTAVSLSAFAESPLQ
jgi:predicted nucleic acid-binding protein